MESLPNLQQLCSLARMCLAAAACLTHRAQYGRRRVHGLSSSAPAQHGRDAVPVKASSQRCSLCRGKSWGNRICTTIAAFWQVLPEVTTDRWRYEGTASKRGHHADVWVLRLEPDEGYGTYHSNYTLYVTKVTTVLYQHMCACRRAASFASCPASS